MTSSITSPADLVNLSLRRIGYKLRVSSLFEGSFAARQILDIYAQTRDELLMKEEWDFAERNATMTLLKSAPPGGYIPPLTWSNAYPPLAWLYEYAYPDDCLKVRAVKPVPLFIPNFDPQTYVFSVDNDNSLATPAKVILCNVTGAVLVYTGQITDPTGWEADFVEAFAAALARRIAPVLANMDAAKLEAADESVAAAVGDTERG